MLAELTSYAAYTHPGWGDGAGGWRGDGPGWWLVFPITFLVLVLGVAGYLIYRNSSGQTTRRAAERTLAERYASGEISEEELRQRRAVLRERR